MGDLVFNGGIIILYGGHSFSITDINFRQIRHLGWKSTVHMILTLISFGLHFIPPRFTVRNVTVNNAQTGVFSTWNWGKTSRHIVSIHRDID